MKTSHLAAGLFVLAAGLFLYGPAFSKQNNLPPPSASACPPPLPPHDSNGHPLRQSHDGVNNCQTASAATTVSSSTAQVVTDDKRHAVRVLIGGKEILTIDALGVHVNGNIEYAGKITNTGKSGTGENPTAP
jgi:hypothetical protein